MNENNNNPFSIIAALVFTDSLFFISPKRGGRVRGVQQITAFVKIKRCVFFIFNFPKKKNLLTAFRYRYAPTASTSFLIKKISLNPFYGPRYDAIQSRWNRHQGKWIKWFILEVFSIFHLFLISMQSWAWNSMKTINKMKGLKPNGKRKQSNPRVMCFFSQPRPNIILLSKSRLQSV